MKSLLLQGVGTGLDDLLVGADRNNDGGRYGISPCSCRWKGPSALRLRQMKGGME